MLIIRRISVYLIPLVIFCLLFSLFLAPQWYYYVFLLINLLIIFSFWYLISHKTKLADFINLLIGAVFFINGALLFIIFLENVIFQGIIILFVSVFLFTYFNVIFKEFYKQPVWQLNNLKNYLYFGQLIALWFLTTASYGLLTFININIILACALILLVSLIFFWQALWLFAYFSNSENLSLISQKPVSLPLLIIIFMAAFGETAALINLLSLTIYFKGLIFTMVYYLFCEGFFQDQEQIIKRRLFKRSLIGVIIILILTFILSYLIL